MPKNKFQKGTVYQSKKPARLLPYNKKRLGIGVLDFIWNF